MVGVVEDFADYELVLPHDELKHNSAGLRSRLIAYLIDILVGLAIFSFAFFFAFTYVSGIKAVDVASIEAFLYENPQLFGIIEAGLDSVFLFYFIIFEWRTGQTIGKRVTGIKLENISFGQAVVRNLTKAFFLSFPFIAFFDFIWVFISKERRRLTEILSGTKVLKQPVLRAEMSWQEF
jgi:uncharacterized RDD family membrane protein YckC